MLVPLARSEELTVEELGDELLVYDLKTHRAHSLSPAAARVWRRCDGTTPAASVADELGLDTKEVARAIDELAACELLAPSARDGISRRELSVRVAKGAVAAASAPLIISIVAPTPAAAQSVPEGCEGLLLGCITNCGNQCNAVTVGCFCCQYDGLSCSGPGGGDGQERGSNEKFCAPTLALCPPDVNGGDPSNPTARPCANLCEEDARATQSESSSLKSQSTGAENSSTGTQPATDTQTPPATVEEIPSAPPPEPPTTPAPETPTTPAPTTLEP